MNTIRIDQQIGYDPWWEEGVSSASIREQLAKMDGTDLTVWINSPGGDVLEGSAIYTALKEYPGKVTIKVEALAASAASVIAMAADELYMSPTSYLMIHRASTIALGNVDDMDEAARQLRAIDNGIVEAYRLKTGMSRARILKLMQEETWLNAKAATEMGFADGILYTNAPDERAPGEEEETEDITIKAVASLRPLLFSHAGMKPMHATAKPGDAEEQPDKECTDPEEETSEETTAPEEAPNEDPEEKPGDKAPADATEPQPESGESDEETEDPEEDAEEDPEDDPDKAEPEDPEALLQAKAALLKLLDY